MRPNFIKTSVALFLYLPVSALSNSAVAWNGSYSADGQCFCAGTVASGVENTIVPTPIGGQTVAQVCQRVGPGPGLEFIDGVYNHPVYVDYQCGHGPGDSQINVSEADCAGSLDGKGAASESCQPPGPKWDLKQAFLRQEPDTKQENTASSRKGSTGLLDKPVVTSVALKRGNDAQELKATVISSASTAGRALPKRESLAPFAGKTVTIGGKRYMQARKDLPANGGEPGARIVVDGSVYLLDDGSINPTDLYRKKPSKVVKPNKTSGKKSRPPTKKVATVSGLHAKANAADKVSGQRRVDSVPVPGADGASIAKSSRPVKKTPSSKANLTALDVANEINRQRSPVTTQSPASEASLKAVTGPKHDKKQLVQSNEKAKANTSKQSDVLTNQSGKDSAGNAARSTESQITTVSDDLKGADSSTAATQVSLLSALKLPDSVNNKRKRFSYVEAVPVTFDFGDSGLLVKASSESHSKFHYVGRIGVAQSYREAMLGGGYYLTPATADRLTVVLQAGVEYGSFDLSDEPDSNIKTDYSDTGLYFGAATRLIVSNRFELRGGLGYSTFFQGDLLMFGGAYWQINPQLDFVSRFEIGDNDLVGLGIRFYY